MLPVMSFVNGILSQLQLKIGKLCVCFFEKLCVCVCVCAHAHVRVVTAVTEACQASPSPEGRWGDGAEEKPSVQKN